MKLTHENGMYVYYAAGIRKGVHVRGTCEFDQPNKQKPKCK